MIGQLALFEVMKAAGMRRANDAADEAWKTDVDTCINDFAATGGDFTAENVRAWVGDPPSHPNAFGARFHAAARKGLIVRVGYTEANRTSAHARVLTVWRGK